MKILTRVLGLSAVLSIAWVTYAVLIVSQQKSTLAHRLNDLPEALTGDSVRGEYMAAAAGCVACHTDVSNGGKFMAGGVPITTSFGTFYSPNITPDNRDGIGAWSQADFIKAMILGLTPAGKHYFPAFPYTSYSAMQLQDIVDLHSWLKTLLPVAEESPAHDIIWPVSERSTMLLWKALFFHPERQLVGSDRGRYLVSGAGHCAECHAPRNRLGGVNTQLLYGNRRGPDGHAVPGITVSDLSEWEIEDLELFLEVGITPSGDFVGGHMADVVEYSTGRLTAEDRSHIASYLLSNENQ